MLQIQIKDFNATTVQLPQEARDAAFNCDFAKFESLAWDCIPTEFKRHKDSQSPQEPLFIITMDVPGIFAMIGNGIGPDDGSEESAMLAPDCIEELGESIVNHIHQCWPNGDVDEVGRPIGWDADYQPRPKKISFIAPSIEHAYLSTLNAVASESDSNDAMEEISAKFGVLSEEEFEEYPNERHVDKETEITFLHMQCKDGLVSCKSIKLRDFVEQAKEFCIEYHMQTMTSYPTAALWPQGVTNPRAYRFGGHRICE